MSITFLVSEEVLFRAIDESISWEAFRELTGTKIDLDKRIGKQICIQRSKGHLYFYDTKFIVGERYIYDGLPYKCSYINANGTALLSYKMHTVTLTEPLAFRIA
jgi:hypothetical protein